MKEEKGNIKIRTERKEEEEPGGIGRAAGRKK